MGSEDGFPPYQEAKTCPAIAVIPVHKEERFITSLIIKTRKYVDLIIVVDDGSSDQTAEIAKEAGALVIQQIKNMGKARALNLDFIKAKEFFPKVVEVPIRFCYGFFVDMTHSMKLGRGLL